MVKGKGEMTTYVLLGERSEPLGAGTLHETASSRLKTRAAGRTSIPK